MELNNKSIKEVRKMKSNNKKMRGLGFKDIVIDKALWITLIISGLIAFLGNESVLRSARVAIGSAQVEMSSALLGLVLAGLAIFIVFLDKKYVALIERIFGVGTELIPFKLTAIVAILCLGFGMLLILLGEPSALFFRFVLLGALWSFTYLLWQIYELVKFLAEHAKARAKQIQKEEINNDKK